MFYKESKAAAAVKPVLFSTEHQMATRGGLRTFKDYSFFFAAVAVASADEHFSDKFNFVVFPL